LHQGLKKLPLHTAYQFLWNAADWIYPPTCGGCGKPGQRWCEDCQTQVQEINQDTCCTICGTPLNQKSLCPTCRSTPPPFSALRSWAIYKDPLREAIHALKYRNDLGISEIVSRPLINLIQTMGWVPDLITCVPLSPQRMLERGYNQSSLVAFPIASAMGIPYKPNLLERTRDTSSQVKLSRQERIENMQNAFLANPKSANNRSVLVIDDVTTTGATMFSCARALLESGAREIFGITIARAILQTEARPA